MAGFDDGFEFAPAADGGATLWVRSGGEPVVSVTVTHTGALMAAAQALAAAGVAEATFSDGRLTETERC